MAAAKEEGVLRVRRVTRGVAEVVQSVRSFFEEEKLQHQRLSVGRVVERTARATGLSERSVERISAAKSDFDSYPDEELEETRERDSVVAKYWWPIIREIVSRRFLSGQKVTLNEIRIDLIEGLHTRAHPPFPYSRTTLYRTLHRMGYSCAPGASHYTRLREKASIVLQRVKYIRKMQELRAAGRTIFYQDET